jgi:hypothetical protein
MAWTKKQDPNSKTTRAKMVESEAHMVQYLPTKYKVLSSNPITTKKKKKRLLSKFYLSQRFSKVEFFLVVLMLARQALLLLEPLLQP